MALSPHMVPVAVTSPTPAMAVPVASGPPLAAPHLAVPAGPAVVSYPPTYPAAAARVPAAYHPHEYHARQEAAADAAAQTALQANAEARHQEAEQYRQNYRRWQWWKMLVGKFPKPNPYDPHQHHDYITAPRGEFERFYRGDRCQCPEHCCSHLKVAALRRGQQIPLVGASGPQVVPPGQSPPRYHTGRRTHRYSF